MTESKEDIKKSLRYSIIDGCAWSVMFGFGENYLAPFAIFLKASNTLIGLLASVPQLIGAVAQIISVDILDRVGKRKSLIMRPVIVQMLTWLPMFLLPFFWPSQGPLLLIICAIIYVIAGNFAAPAWNSLMGDLVDPDKRGDYFGYRNRITSIFTFGSILLGGFVLHLWKPVNLWMGYGIIFGVALLARGVSAYYLNRMIEPAYVVTAKDRFSLWDFLRRSPKSNFARFVFYIAFINLAVLISGPFFTVYMFRSLHFSYAQFTIAAATTILTQVLTMRYWGRLGDRFGNKKILTITGWLVPVVPVLWLFSANFYWIILCQVAAGFTWGGFSLASSNYIFDAVSPPKRARCVAYFTLFNSVGMFLGALLGAWVSGYVSNTLLIFGWHIQLVSSLEVLFLLSGLLRLAISAVFLPLIREVRETEPIPTWKLVFQITQIPPIFGSIFEIFTGVGKKEK